MIQGFHVDITGQEMKDLLLERQKYHEERAAVYEKKAADIKAALKDVEDEMHVGKMSNSTASNELEKSASNHKDQVVFYKFAAAHIPVTETFRLAKEDLQLLGIMGSRYY